MTQKPYDDFDEDESNEIANQIRNKAMFHIKVEELKRKQADGSWTTLDSSFPKMAILEVSCQSKNLVKRWQMHEKNHFVINLNHLVMTLWIADKDHKSLDSVSSRL